MIIDKSCGAEFLILLRSWITSIRTCRCIETVIPLEYRQSLFIRSLFTSLLILKLTIDVPVLGDPIHVVEPRTDGEVINPLESVLADSQEEVIHYTAAFFSRYRPSTALDMVEQVPGFQLDDGSGVRGFGSAAGNILINDRRPSSKQALPSAILSRIPASHVERIQLHRGQMRGINLQGEDVVVNVILYKDTPAEIRWEAFVRDFEHVKPWMLGVNLSLSDRWEGIVYNVGTDIRRTITGEEGTEYVFDGDNVLVEERFDDAFLTNFVFEQNMNASTAVGETLLGLNFQLGVVKRDEYFPSLRVPVAPGAVSRTEIFGDESTAMDVEIGTDAERLIYEDLIGKLIVLYYHSDAKVSSDHRTRRASDDMTLFFQVADSERRASEAILRLETDWTGWEGHAPQINIEGTHNSLENVLVRTEDNGGGAVVVALPGANTRVKELRGDILLKDTWSLGQWVLDYGLGAEVSEIAQTGDAEQIRFFSFIKPQGLVTWAPRQDWHTRFRLAREVAQLDFNDFVSSTFFLDEDLALGNPDLKPQSTWLAELSHERRFGDLGVLTLTGFHHWIQDVQDLLPITDEFEAPGNIGNGRLWGVILESTIPLEWVGLGGARLNLYARWHDSSATDPVTGQQRILSRRRESGGGPGIAGFVDNTDHYGFGLDFRQDFQAARVAWGWDMRSRTERSQFKVNELDIFDEELQLNTFIETTRWLGLKIRFVFDNILDYSDMRDRTVFHGRRDLAFTGVDRREISDYLRGRRYELFLSGSF